MGSEMCIRDRTFLKENVVGMVGTKKVTVNTFVPDGRSLWDFTSCEMD